MHVKVPRFLARLFVKFYKARTRGVRKAGEHRNTGMGHQSQVPLTFFSNRHFFVSVKILISSKCKLLIPMEIFLKKELNSGPKMEQGSIK